MGNRVRERVIQRLLSAGGIEVEPGGHEDLVVSVGGDEAVMVLEVKHRFTDEVVEQMVRLPRARRERTVLVVPELSAKRRDELRARGISWMEYDSGLAHIRVPGLAIELPEVPREVQRRGEAPVPSLAGKAGIVVEALIELAREGPLVAQPDVAELSGSTQAWTSRVFSALVEAGALEVVGKGPAKMWKPRVEDLLRLWIEDGGPSPTETGVYVWARTDNDLIEALGRMGGELNYAIGGVAAANLHEPTLTSVAIVNVWVPVTAPPSHIARELGGEVVDSGANLLLWQASGDPALRLASPLCRWREEAAAGNRELSIVTPPRAVVESLRSTGRGPEAGENLRNRILVQANLPGGRPVASKE